MKKLAIACTAAALMSLAACGGQPEAANNATNNAVANEVVDANAVNAIDNAANATAATNNAAPAANAAE